MMTTFLLYAAMAFLSGINMPVIGCNARQAGATPTVISISSTLSTEQLSNTELWYKGRQVGIIRPDGEVFINGRSVGQARSNGEIFVRGSKSGDIRSNGEVFQSGRKVGEVRSNGDVFQDGRKVGEVRSNGDVYQNGSCVGNVKNMRNRNWAAIIYFFGFFNF